VTAFVLLAVLTGPPLNQPTLTLRIHCGRDFSSQVIKSELSRLEPYFLEKWQFIESHYRLELDDDANLEPTYSIGRGGSRERFRPGTFRCSGTFIRSLESLCELDQWERRQGDSGTYMQIDGSWVTFTEIHKPVPYPPVDEP